MKAGNNSAACATSMPGSERASARHATAMTGIRPENGEVSCLLGELHLSLLPLCDRWKIIIAVDRFLAHMLATIEQEDGERYGDQPSEQGAKLSVRCPVVSHHVPPTIQLIGGQRLRRIEVPALDGRALSYGRELE